MKQLFGNKFKISGNTVTPAWKKLLKILLRSQLKYRIRFLEILCKKHLQLHIFMNLPSRKCMLFSLQSTTVKCYPFHIYASSYMNEACAYIQHTSYVPNYLLQMLSRCCFWGEQNILMEITFLFKQR